MDGFRPGEAQVDPMDVPISPEVIKRRRTRRWLVKGAALALLVLLVLGLTRLKPVGPSVE
jgi:hypothetical protein